MSRYSRQEVADIVDDILRIPAIEITVKHMSWHDQQDLRKILERIK